MMSPPDDKTTRPKFPESAWIGAFDRYFHLVAPTTEASDQFIWAGFAAVLSALASLCVRLRWGADLMRPVVNFILIGDTGRDRKTTAIFDAKKLILDPLRPRSVLPNEPDPFEVVVGHGSGEGLMEAIADKPWWPPGVSKRDPPVVKTGRAALYVFDEFGALMEKARRDQAGGLINFLLQLFDCPPELRLPVRSAPLVCTNAHGNVVGASTHEYLSTTLTESLIRNGLVNRFLLVEGEPGAPVPIRPPVDPAAHQELLAVLRQTMQVLAGSELVFDAAAVEEHKAHYNEQHNRQAGSELLEAATAREHVIAVRLAMLFAFGEASATIRQQHVRAAWDLTNYGREVTRRLLDRMVDQNWRQVEKRLIKAALRIGSQNDDLFTRTQVGDSVRGGNGLDARTFNTAWDALVRAGDFIPSDDAGELFRVSAGRQVTP